MIRGYLLPNIENGLTILSKQYAMLGAVIITSGLFALLHLSNPNVSFFHTEYISCRCLVYCSIHFYPTTWISGRYPPWSLFLGAVGLPVSGFLLPATLIDLKVSRLDLLFDNSYGPEAGLIVSIALMTGIIIASRYRQYSHTN